MKLSIESYGWASSRLNHASSHSASFLLWTERAAENVYMYIQYILCVDLFQANFSLSLAGLLKDKAVSRVSFWRLGSRWCMYALILSEGSTTQLWYDMMKEVIWPTLLRELIREKMNEQHFKSFFTYKFVLAATSFLKVWEIEEISYTHIENSHWRLAR